MIIDAHTHGFHGGSLDLLGDAGGNWARKHVEGMRKAARMVPQFLDAVVRVEGLDRNGFDFQVVTPFAPADPNLLPADTATQVTYARAVNDNMARLMEESKGRLLTIGAVPLVGFHEGGQQEMERAIEALGLKGFTLPSNVNGKPLDLPEFEPFWAKAEEMGVPVYIHPRPEGIRSYEAVWDLSHVFGWPYETSLALARLVCSGMMERHPGVKIVSHHLGGGMIPFFIGRVIESYDLSGGWGVEGPALPRPVAEYFSLFYYDTAVGGNPAAIRCTYDVFGADQIVFATDAPFGPEGGESRLKTYPGVVRSLGLPASDTEKILAGNARRILNLA